MTIKSIKLIPVITSKHCSIYIELNSQYKFHAPGLVQGAFSKSGPAAPTRERK